MWTFPWGCDSASPVPAEPTADRIGTVDFHFDIMCPWAYQASLWIRDVRDHLLDRWYLATATALHVEGRKPHRREVAGELLRQLDLDPALAGQAIDDPSTTDEVRADHDRLARLGGWGVPTLVFGGDQALFGPVLIKPPTGPAAVRLWHLITGWLEFPQVYEVQRPKSQQDLSVIAETFRPYLEARDWITIQKETP
jgi:Mycothiol-dependent nitroreductase Rv2466c